jgi:hypothetical protein
MRDQLRGQVRQGPLHRTAAGVAGKVGQVAACLDQPRGKRCFAQACFSLNKHIAAQMPGNKPVHLSRQPLPAGKRTDICCREHGPGILHSRRQRHQRHTRDRGSGHRRMGRTVRPELIVNRYRYQCGELLRRGEQTA